MPQLPCQYDPAAAAPASGEMRCIPLGPGGGVKVEGTITATVPLPAAAVLDDAGDNALPVSSIAARLMVWTGAVWRRLTLGQTTMALSVPVALASNQSAVPSTYANASAAAMGSQAATGSSVALGGATSYTGGITVWNSDTALPLFVGLGTITALAGANKVCLGPGQGFHFVRGDLSAIQTITASGSPILNWVGYTS